MVREIQPFSCRLGIYNCIYDTICLSELYSMLNTAIEICIVKLVESEIKYGKINNKYCYNNL